MSDLATLSRLLVQAQEKISDLTKERDKAIAESKRKLGMLRRAFSDFSTVALPLAGTDLHNGISGERREQE